MFYLQYTAQAIKSLKKIPKKQRIKILKAVDGLAVSPYIGKKLQGELAGLFSLRVWPYRILYVVKKKEILVVILDIGHRQNIYK
ncbi:MAG: type II toxin-antitoxin system RelE/ParE family toxin [Candidatus Yonathbacteria bacterium]|nr:type II toxin-antitoxin system RelE/ParE family toxin [Candidatus Niyogibacteria bacterium]MBI5817066.1 type II toxin-antitoxin system RelE/ParE family toxin [Candidatus Yonathbacteria bacterium]